MKNAVWLVFVFMFLSIIQIGYSQPADTIDALLAVEAYDVALEAYTQLSEKALIKKDYRTYLKINTEQAVLLQELEEHEVAQQLLSQTLQTVVNKVAPDTLMALAYHKLGVSEYNLNQELKAIQHWERAIGIRSDFPSLQNDVAKGYKNIGLAYEKTNDIVIAAQNYKKGLDLLLANPERDEYVLADIYRELGYVSSLQNKVEEAEQYYQSGLKLAQRIYKEEPWMLALFHSDLSQLYTVAGSFDRVVYHAQVVIDLYESLEDKYDEDLKALADGYNNIANAYSAIALENSDKVSFINKAISSMKKAIVINQTYGKERQNQLILNNTNLAAYYNQLGNHDVALELLNRNWLQAQKSDDLATQSILLNNRGRTYLKQKQYKQAITDFQKAIQLLVYDFDSDDIFVNPSIQNAIIHDKPALVEILHNKATTLNLLSKDISYQQLALSSFDSLFQLIRIMQKDVDSDVAKRFLAGKAKAFFDSGIKANADFFEATQDKQYIQRIFELIEQSKAVSLLSQLNASQAKHQSNIPAQFLQRTYQLKSTIRNLEQDIFEAEREGQPTLPMQNALIKTNRAAEKLMDSLKLNFPKYFQQQYELEALNLLDFQANILKSNQAVLQYFLGAERLFILYADQTAVKFVSKTLPDDLLQQIEAFRTMIVTQQSDVGQYQQLAFGLYELLFEDILPEQAAIKRLVIIPDGVLAYLPFEILTSQYLPEEQDFRFLPYLLKKYAISYSYSASVLAKQMQFQPQIAIKQLAAFAPSYEAQLANTDQLTRILVRSGNYNLPGALAEVEAVKDIVGGELFKMTEATEVLFKSIAQQYRCLHLSMHGIVNDSFPMRSKLLFYESDQDSLEDGSLYAYELYNMQLYSDLVVLSACNTGMGQLQKGEGVMSLAHAFAYAGVASTVMSLWQVPDAATSEIVQGFYKNIKVGLPKDQAMRQAKVDFLENTISLKQAHPFYWAALLNYGNQSPLEFSTSKPFLKYVILGVLLLGLLIIGLNWKRSKAL